MNIIFLDFDGVLVTESYVMDCTRHGKPSRDAYGHEFDEKCIKHYEWLLNETNAKVVISSSWRIEGYQFIQDLWYDRSMRGTILGFTPYIRLHQRDVEIQTWLRDAKLSKMLPPNESHSYVILDDDIEFFSDAETKKHLITCSWEYGLTRELAEEAKALLLSDEGRYIPSIKNHLHA